MEGSCPSVNEKKVPANFWCAKPRERGWNGVQMFLDEPGEEGHPERKVSSEEQRRDSSASKISNPKTFTGKTLIDSRNSEETIDKEETSSQRNYDLKKGYL